MRAKVRESSGQALVEGGVVAHEPQVADGLLAGVFDREVELLRPPRPHAGRLAEGVPLGGQVLEGVLEGRLHPALVDEGAPELDDGRDVLDPHRADLHAGHARRARPQRLLLDDVAGHPGVAIAREGSGGGRPHLAVEEGVDAVLAVGPLAQVEDEVPG
jgi:hypothetical protein